MWVGDGIEVDDDDDETGEEEERKQMSGGRNITERRWEWELVDEDVTPSVAVGGKMCVGERWMRRGGKQMSGWRHMRKGRCMSDGRCDVLL